MLQMHNTLYTMIRILRHSYKLDYDIIKYNFSIALCIKKKKTSIDIWQYYFKFYIGIVQNFTVFFYNTVII